MEVHRNPYDNVLARAGRRQKALDGTLAALDRASLVSSSPEVQGVPSSLDVEVPYLRFPVGGTIEETRSRVVRYGLFFALVAAEATEGTPTKWMNYILSYLAAIFPAVMADTPRVREVTVTGDQSHRLLELMDTLLDIGETIDIDSHTREATEAAIGETTRGTVVDTCRHILRLADDLGLPTGTPSACAYRVGACRDANQVVGHLSLVAFLMGKKITNVGERSNVSSITMKRPAAIEKKYLGERRSPILSGALRMSDVAHEGIYNAWGYHGAIRAHLVKGFCQFAAADATPLQEVFNTTFKLLEYSGIQSYVIVRTFLSAYDFAWGLSTIQADLQFWEASCRSLLEVDVSVRKYVKLILSDKTSIFKRPNMPRLISLAVQVLSRDAPTLKNFYYDAVPTVMAEFETMRAAFERIPDTVAVHAEPEQPEGEEGT
jgi:hypothetical protein